MIFVMDGGKSMAAQAARTSLKYRTEGIWRQFRKFSISEVLSKHPSIKTVRWVAASKKWHLEQRKAGKMPFNYILEHVSYACRHLLKTEIIV